MYLKTVTVRKKIKGKRAKKVYRYVRVINRTEYHYMRPPREYVVASLGELSRVRESKDTLIRGLENLPKH